MQAVNYTTLRENMKECFDTVSDTFEPMIVTRKDENIVVMSQSYYDSLMETVYLMSNKNNYEHLNKSIDQYKNGIVNQHELVEED